MCPSSPITDEVVESELDPFLTRYEPVAVMIALGTFLSILAVGGVLYLVEFSVDPLIVKALGYASIPAAILWFKRTKPTSKLTPSEKTVRAQRRIGALVGLLFAASILGSVVAAYQLHTWDDWLILIVIASSPIGVGIMVNTHFGMG